MSETTMTDTPAESTSTDSVDVSQEVVSNPVVESEGSDIWNDEEFSMNEPPIDGEPSKETTEQVETLDEQQSKQVDWEARYKEQLQGGDSKLDNPSSNTVSILLS